MQFHIVKNMQQFCLDIWFKCVSQKSTRNAEGQET